MNASHRSRPAPGWDVIIAAPASVVLVLLLTLGVAHRRDRAAEPPPTITSLLVDLNSASATDLRLLPSIGPALAERIIADRKSVGPFASVGDLDRVPGVGPRTISKVKPYATVEPTDTRRDPGVDSRPGH